MDEEAIKGWISIFILIGYSAIVYRLDAVVACGIACFHIAFVLKWNLKEKLEREEFHKYN